MDKSGVKLFKLSAIDELNLNRLIGNAFPYAYSRLNSLEGAYAVAHNASLLCCSLKNAFGIKTPMDILSEFSLDEISSLTKTYHEIYCEGTEFGFNESFEEETYLE